MIFEINTYKSSGDGLRANPDIKEISDQHIIYKQGLGRANNKNDAKVLAQNTAKTLFLIQAHALGVDFFTDRESDWQVISFKSSLSIFSSLDPSKSQTYIAAIVEGGVGYVGTYTDYNSMKEKRAQQLEIARGLVRKLSNFPAKYCNDVLNMIKRKEGTL
ncbi:hypothetical protein GOV14_06730 [Candidatus Pacearchaeota archaeon]|nr:hypothetical protein [Candidatus Pacearchaeota archaeon]